MENASSFRDSLLTIGSVYSGSEIFKRNQERKINLIKALPILIELMGKCGRKTATQGELS